MLWVTPRNLCTDRGTALWTTRASPRETSLDLHFFHPRAVGEKKFPNRSTNGTNGPAPSRHPQ
ncbi:hypothetical protein B7R87_15935 [Streptomyces tsukubensis]|nr:hypothetical protein B7R87_15935 [Streptomyces tsukubensis]